MSVYVPNTRDILFNLNTMGRLESLADMPAFADVDEELVTSVVEEAARFTRDVLEPLNRIGDRHGATLTEAGVRTTEGFGDAYRQMVEDGWISLSFPEQEGGQALPTLVDTAFTELLQTANLSFAMCPGLASGAAGSIRKFGNDELRSTYLPKLASGEWSAAMCLTEPQSGSDLSLLRTQAVRHGDHHLLTGQKIFISWGDHDMSENIVHLVLARTPEAPPGTRGISLFLVPKFVPKPDGSLGNRNDIKVVGVEEKLGLHGSPTCTLSYGDNGGAVGFLVGEENQGLAAMFVMMNHTRMQVGLQGVSAVERAYQHALAYANDRVQGYAEGSRKQVQIVQHGDVRRLLALMKSGSEAMRSVAYEVAAYIDQSHHAKDIDVRAASTARLALLTPICKGWSTELAQELTQHAIQVHGGMGFVEETGVSQYMRDVRVATIYEGTTAIQALDLIRRKLLRDRGQAMQELIADMLAECDAADHMDPAMAEIAAACRQSTQLLQDISAWLLDNDGAEDIDLGTVAFDYLMMTGYVIGGWQLLRAASRSAQAIADDTADADFYRQKIASATFYADHILPRTLAHAAVVRKGGKAHADLDLAMP